MRAFLFWRYSEELGSIMDITEMLEDIKQITNAPIDEERLLYVTNANEIMYAETETELLKQFPDLKEHIDLTWGT